MLEWKVHGRGGGGRRRRKWELMGGLAQMHRVICLLTVGMLVCWSTVYTGFHDNILSLSTSRDDSSDISGGVGSSEESNRSDNRCTGEQRSRTMQEEQG